MRTNPKIVALTSTVCQTGYNLLVPSTMPNGNSPISLNLTTSVTTIQDVIFKIDGLILGRGVQVGTNPQWQMTWNTQYTNPGSHSVSVDIYFTDSTICSIPPVSTNITTGAAAVAPVLNAGSTPASFQGLTNQVINFNLSAYLSSTAIPATDESQFTYFHHKTTTIGSITPLDGTAILKFSTGPVAGTGSINVYASYAGFNKSITIPITIQAQTATPAPAPIATVPNAPTPTNGGTPTGTSTTSTPGATTTPLAPTTTAPSEATIAAASAASIEAEKPVKDCVLLKLGDVRYKAISSGLSRPTAAEFEAMNQCFVSRNHVLPSSFVPVAPTDVKKQPVTKDTSVQKLENFTTGSTVRLKFKGKAKRKTVVLLYVYSEPLVLSTESDGNGDWNYALEDPLQPGNHEVYAVTNKGDGTYERSSVLDFAIAKAEASAANPNSYSLKLSIIQPTTKDNNKSIILYFGAIVMLTTSMLGIVGFVLIRKNHRKKAPVDVTQVITPQEQSPPPATVADDSSPIANMPANTTPEPNNYAPEPVSTSIEPPTIIPTPEEPTHTETLT